MSTDCGYRSYAYCEEVLGARLRLTRKSKLGTPDDGKPGDIIGMTCSHYVPSVESSAGVNGCMGFGNGIERTRELTACILCQKNLQGGKARRALGDPFLTALGCHNMMEWGAYE